MQIEHRSVPDQSGVIGLAIQLEIFGLGADAAPDREIGAEEVRLLEDHRDPRVLAQVVGHRAGAAFRGPDDEEEALRHRAPSSPRYRPTMSWTRRSSPNRASERSRPALPNRVASSGSPWSVRTACVSARSS